MRLNASSVHLCGNQSPLLTSPGGGDGGAVGRLKLFSQMNKELNLNLELQEISENDLHEINGGYGYWEGHNQGSAAFSAIISDA